MDRKGFKEVKRGSERFEGINGTKMDLKRFIGIKRD